MLVTSVLSLKGGVGKTTVTLGLAGAAWDRGLRTLVIDLDPQANTSTGLDLGRAFTTAAQVLAHPAPGALAAAVSASEWGPNVHGVVGSRTLDYFTGPAALPPASLRIAMGGLTDYDVVLIDTPPSLGSLTRNALTASTLALVVTEPSLYSLHGAQQALEAVDAARADNLRLQAGGIVVNRWRAQATEHRYRMDELTAAHGHLLFTPPIPERVAVQQAAGACVPVQVWRSQGAREVSDVFEDYLDRILKHRSAAGPLLRGTA